jgi:hypothetical protein
MGDPSMKKLIPSFFFVCVLAWFCSTPSQAASKKVVGASLNLLDMSGTSQFEFAMPMVPQDHLFGFFPRLGYSHNLGNLVFGLDLPMAFYSPEQGDSAFRLGNLSLQGHYQSCSQGSWNLCWAAGMGLSAPLTESDSTPDRISRLSGILAHQGFLYYAPDSLDVHPMAALYLAKYNLFFELEVGSDVLVPFLNTGGRDLEFSFTYGLAVGYALSAMVAPVLELRGTEGLTDGCNVSMLFVNVGARFDFGGWQPFALFTLPLGDDASALSTIDFMFSVGLNIAFGPASQARSSSGSSSWSQPAKQPTEAGEARPAPAVVDVIPETLMNLDFNSNLRQTVDRFGQTDHMSESKLIYKKGFVNCKQVTFSFKSDGALQKVELYPSQPTSRQQVESQLGSTSKIRKVSSYDVLVYSRQGILVFLKQGQVFSIRIKAPR